MNLVSSTPFPKVCVYVITTKLNHDRIESINDQAQKFGFKPRFLLGFDADQLKSEDMAMFGTEFKPATASCVLKHLEAQRCLLASNSSVALVLEDDAILNENFNERLHNILSYARPLQSGWLIFLGGSDDRLNRNHVCLCPDDLIEVPISTAEAYLFDRESATRRIHWLERNRITLPADHFLRFVDNACSNKQFRPVEPLCSQGSITGEFVTTIDENRKGHSVRYIAIRYRWRVLYKRWLPKIWAKITKCIAIK